MRTVNGVTLQSEAWQNYSASAAAVTPSDTNPLADATRFLFVGGAGNLKVLFADDTAPVTLTGVLAGSVLPLSVIQVFATGTTATSLVALF